NACVAFSPDGQRLAAVNTDYYLPTEVKVWDAREVTPEVQTARREAARQAAPSWHQRLAEDFLAQEQGPAALFHLSRAIELGTVDGTLWFQYALLLLDRDDRAGYRRHCARLLERFGQTENPEIALWLVWNCKLTADAVPDFAPLVSLAEKHGINHKKDVFNLN